MELTIDRIGLDLQPARVGHAKSSIQIHRQIEIRTRHGKPGVVLFLIFLTEAKSLLASSAVTNEYLAVARIGQEDGISMSRHGSEKRSFAQMRPLPFVLPIQIIDLDPFGRANDQVVLSGKVQAVRRTIQFDFLFDLSTNPKKLHFPVTCHQRATIPSNLQSLDPIETRRELTSWMIFQNRRIGLLKLADVVNETVVA